MGRGSLAIVAGTRPELIKIWPVLKSLERLGQEFTFIWTLQHYDYEMSKIFLEQLDLPEPDVYLDEKPIENADLEYKLSHITSRLARVLKRIGSSYVYALGDTTTVLAAALVSGYTNRTFIHDEAGMRSFDLSMPEEVNRRIADVIADVHLAPTVLATVNLIMEGVSDSSIFLVGSTAVDSVSMIMPVIKRREDDILNRFGLDSKRFVILTVHRRGNLVRQRLIKIVKIIIEACRIASRYDLRIIFPIHPHTKKRMIEEGVFNKINHSCNLLITEPLGYVEFMSLLKNARLAITDSGGIQVEAAVLGVPLITLRDRTEWPETVIIGLNKLVDIDIEIFSKTLSNLLNKNNVGINDVQLAYKTLGDGKSGLRIAKIIDYIINNKIKISKKLVNMNIKQPYIMPVMLNNIKREIKNVIICFDENGMPVIKKRVAKSINDIAACINREAVGTYDLLDQIVIDWQSVDDLIEDIKHG